MRQDIDKHDAPTKASLYRHVALIITDTYYIFWSYANNENGHE